MLLYDPSSLQHEIYLGDNGLNSWEPLLFSSNQFGKDETTRAVQGCDLIRIKHSEFESYLSSSLEFRGAKQEVYFRKYVGNYPEEETGMESVWEIVHPNKINQGAPIILEDTRVCIRHFNSGKMIEIEPSEMSVGLESSLAKRSQKSNSSFHFSGLQIGFSNLMHGRCYKIIHRNETGKELYMYPSDKALSRDWVMGKQETIQLIESYIFTPLEEIFFEEVKNEAAVTRTDRTIDSYLIQMISAEEQENILFLRSVIHKFNELSGVFKSTDKSVLNNQILVDIEFYLKNIICFLHDKEYDPNEPYEKSIDGLEPSNKKQKIFKDLGFLEILIDFIHIPFLNSFYQLKDVHKVLFIPQVLTLSYNCIRMGIKEYRPNELFASQWLDLMIRYFLSELDGSINAKETLTELIDNNQRILESRIKRSTIDEFVSNLVEIGGESRYTEILRATCICDGRPMLKNQNSITESLLKVDHIREKLILPLEYKQEKIMILSPWMGDKEYIALDTLNLESNTRDGGKYFKFYCSLINLLGDICLDRNYSAIEMLKSYFSVITCQKIIISPSFKYSLRSAFCRLMKNLWINVSPFIELKIPSNIKNWNNLDKCFFSKEADDIEEKVKSFQELTSFIFSYIGDKNTLDEWEENGQYVMEIVVMCTKMLKVGFFNELKIFSQLKDSLEKLLSASDKCIMEYNKNKKKFQEESEAVEYEISELEIPDILLQIKIHVLELFGLMRDIQVDIRLNRIMQLYRKNVGSVLMTPQMTEEEKESIVNTEHENISNSFKDGFEKIIRCTEKDEGTFLEITPELVDLIMRQSMYSNKSLKYKSINLLYNLFQESETMRNRINEIQLIDDSTSLRQQESQEDVNRHLFRLAETLEVWIGLENSSKIGELNIHLNRLLADLHIIDTEESNIDGGSPELLEILARNSFLDDSLRLVYDNLYPFYQDLMRNTGCIENLIEILTATISSKETLEELSPKARQIPPKIYLLLAKSTSKNQTNQKYLSNYIESTFIPQFKEWSLRDRICVLINKVIDDNTSVLQNKNLVFNLIRSLFGIVQREKESSYIIAYTLYTIQKMVFNNGLAIKSNQNAIISSMISSDLQEAFSELSPYKIVETIKRDLVLPLIEFECGSRNVSLLPESLCLTLAYFELVSNCSHSMNSFAENISHSLITYESIEEIMKITNRHPLLDYELFKMIFQVYISSHQTYTTHIELFLMNVMKELFIVLENTLNIIIKGHKTIYYLTHKELVSNEHSYSDLVGMLLISVEVFIREVSKKEITKIDRKEFNNFVMGLISSLTKLLSRVKSNSLTEKISKSIKSINHTRENNRLNDSIVPQMSRSITGFKTMPRKTIMSGLNEFASLTYEVALEKAGKELITIFREHEIYAMNSKKVPGRMVGDGFKAIANKYFETMEFKNFSSSEVRILISIAKQENPISFSKFLMSLVKFLDPSNKIDDNIVTIGLKIFQEYLNYSEEEDEDEQRLISTRQQELIDLNVVELLCNIIPQTCNVKLFEDCLEVANSLLEGGNTIGQLDFMRVFETAKGNQVMDRILNEIVRNFSVFMKRVAKKNTETFKSVLLGNYIIDDEKSIPNTKGEALMITILTFFQNLCEGHNLKLQDYLRKYGDRVNHDGKTTKREEENVIVVTVHFFGSLVKFFNSGCTQLIEAILDFLIESVQGPCSGNQKELIRCNILLFAKDFLNDLNSSPEDLYLKGFDLENHETILEINSLFSRTIKLLLAIIELNNDITIIEEIGKCVNFNFLADKLLSVYSSYFGKNEINSTDSTEITRSLNTRLFDEELQEAFSIFGFIQTINDSSNVYKKSILGLKSEKLVAYNFFKVNTGQIELIFEGELQRVYFMVHPVCNYLPEEYKSALMNSVRRDNANEKLSDFLAEVTRYCDLMDHTFKLKKKYKLKLSYLYNVRDLALGVAILINIYIFVNFQTKVDHQEFTNDRRTYNYETFWVLGLVHIFLSGTMILLQLLLRSNLILMNKWRDELSSFKSKLMVDENIRLPREQLVLSYLEKEPQSLSYKELFSILGLKREKETGISPEAVLPRLYYLGYSLMFALQDFEFAYFIFYCVCSIIALTNSIVLIYSLFLFEIIVKNC